MTIQSILPVWTVFLPVLGAIGISLIAEVKEKERNLLALGTAGLTFGLVAFMLMLVVKGNVLESTPFSLLPGLELFFRVDPLGVIFGIVSSGLWVFAVVYSMGYMFGHGHLKRYYFFYILSLSATMGVAISGNLFSLYVFFEYLTLCTYPLVIQTGTKEANRAGLKYIIYCFFGGGLILVAFILLQGLTPGSAFLPGGGLRTLLSESKTLLLVILVLLVAGFGTKAAVIPLHSWLPSAMVAPTPVSALLHAVAVVKSGVFGVLRVLYFVFSPFLVRELGAEVALTILIAFTIITGSILALRQNVLKLRLAYSTISQLGYILLGALLFSPAGFLGGVLHLINHAFMKITLFFCAGMIIEVTGKTRVDELSGIGRRMPLTMLCFTFGALGLIGILPLNGYISKFYLLQGSLEAGKPVYAFVILTSSLLNSMYYLPILISAFFRQGDFGDIPGREAPLAMLLPTVCLAVSCLVLGLFAHKISIPLVARAVSYAF
jgi:multicomponent Na+:H+ antiporter subunit D